MSALLFCEHESRQGSPRAAAWPSGSALCWAGSFFPPSDSGAVGSGPRRHPAVTPPRMMWRSSSCVAVGATMVGPEGAAAAEVLCGPRRCGEERGPSPVGPKGRGAARDRVEIAEKGNPLKRAGLSGGKDSRRLRVSREEEGVCGRCGNPSWARPGAAEGLWVAGRAQGRGLQLSFTTSSRVLRAVVSLGAQPGGRSDFAKQQSALRWTSHSGVAGTNFGERWKKRGRDPGAPFSPMHCAPLTPTTPCSAATRGLRSAAPTLNS